MTQHPWMNQGALRPVFQIPQTCSHAEPYPQEWLDRAAAELARQRHGGPADPDDIKLASEVLAAALSGAT